MPLPTPFANMGADSKRRKRGEQHLRQIYRETQGKELGTAAPRTFAEKLFGRMLALNKKGNRTYSALADKYAVREHIRQKIGDKYLVELLWTGTDARQIPFDTLPERYIIKANHASGMVIRVDGPIDRALVIEQVAGWMRTDYGLADHEHHYAAIPRRIVIEEFLDDGCELGPLNYSFWSFHGEPAVIQVDNRDQKHQPLLRHRVEQAATDNPKEQARRGHRQAGQSHRDAGCGTHPQQGLRLRPRRPLHHRLTRLFR